METQVHILHKSDFYQIRDYQGGCMECTVSKLEHLDDFYIIFVRKGFYEQRVFRQNQEMHVGRLLVSKPDIEFTIRHMANQPDLCTSFQFGKNFYEAVSEQFGAEGSWFFNYPDLHSILLTSTPPIEWLHQRILGAVGKATRLEVDGMVVNLIENVMQVLGNRSVPAPLKEGLKRNHLKTIEHAKDYLLTRFTGEVSLKELADHCCVSMFHLSRVFKDVLHTSPHRYLMEVRLHHAQVLLQNTELQVADVAIQSGFNSPEHFSVAYKQGFGKTPREERL